MLRFFVSPRWLAMIALGFGLASLVSAQVPEPIQVFKGHTAPVYAVALSPDGKIAATGSFDQSIKLWNTQNGAEIRTMAGKNGHKNQILSLDFSPDGRTLASGGSDNQVKLWAVPASEAIASFPLPAAARSIAIRPDGKNLAVGTADGGIALLPPEGMPVSKFSGAAPGVTALTFTPNGQWLISAGTDRILRYWELTQTEPLRAAVGVSTTDLSGLGLINNGAQAVTMSMAGELQFWQGQPPNLPGKAIPVFPAAITAVAQAADGSVIIVGLADQQVQVGRWNDGQVPFKFDKLPASVSSVAVAGNGAAFAAGLENGQLLIWNNDGKPRATVPAHDGPIVTVEFASPTEIFTAGVDGKFKLWSIPTAGFKPTDPPVKPQRDYTIPAKSITAIHPGSSRSVSIDASKAVLLGDPDPAKPARPLGTLAAAGQAVTISRDGNTVAAAAGKQVKIWTISDGKEATLPDLPSQVASLNFSPDRAKLAAGLEDGTVWICDLATAQPVQFLPSVGKVSAVLFHPNQPILLTVGSDRQVVRHPLLLQRYLQDANLIGAAFAVTSNGSQILTAGKTGEVAVWNTNGTKEKSYAATAPVTAIAVSKNNQLVAVAHGEKPKITFFLANTGQVVTEFPSGAAISELQFHPTQAALLGRRTDQRLIAWNVLFDPGQPLPSEFGRVFQEFVHPGPVHGMAISSDGERVFSVAEDRQLRVWAFATDQPLKSLNHPNLVDAVAFDPSGNQIATGCHDGQLRIWDVAKAQQLKSINAHVQPQPSAIYTVAWTPDGKQIITGSYDRSIKIWDVSNGNLVKEFKPAVDRFPPEPVIGQTAPAILGALGGGWLNAPPDHGHRDQVFTIALDAPRQRLASGSSDRTVLLWSFPGGEPIQALANPTLPRPAPGLLPAAHPGFVNAVRITPDGQRLISVGPAPRGQGYLAIWNVSDGRFLAGFELPHGPVQALAIRPDGGAILLGFGYRSRMQTECDAVLFPLPK